MVFHYTRNHLLSYPLLISSSNLGIGTITRQPSLIRQVLLSNLSFNFSSWRGPIVEGHPSKT